MASRGMTFLRVDELLVCLYWHVQLTGWWHNKMDIKPM